MPFITINISANSFLIPRSVKSINLTSFNRYLQQFTWLSLHNTPNFTFLNLTYHHCPHHIFFMKLHDGRGPWLRNKHSGFARARFIATIVTLSLYGNAYIVSPLVQTNWMKNEPKKSASQTSYDRLRVLYGAPNSLKTETSQWEK